MPMDCAATTSSITEPPPVDQFDQRSHPGVVLWRNSKPTVTANGEQCLIYTNGLPVELLLRSEGLSQETIPC